jgi:hypothetical protein
VGVKLFEKRSFATDRKITGRHEMAQAQDYAIWPLLAIALQIDPIFPGIGRLLNMNLEL